MHKRLALLALTAATLGAVVALAVFAGADHHAPSDVVGAAEKAVAGSAPSIADPAGATGHAQQTIASAPPDSDIEAEQFAEQSGEAEKVTQLAHDYSSLAQRAEDGDVIAARTL